MNKNSRLHLQRRTLEFKIRPHSIDAKPVAWFKIAIKGIISNGTEGLEPTDKVGFTFSSKDFTRGEGWLRFRSASEVTFDDVWKNLCSIYQSNSVGLDTETFPKVLQFYVYL